MSNRQELMDAVQRRKPARIPYTFDARPETQELLHAHLGLKASANLAEYFGCNTFDSLWSALGKSPALPEREARNRSGNPDERVDIWGIRRGIQETGGARYWEITGYPLAAAETVADIERYDWPRPAEVVFPDIPPGLDLAAWKRDRVILDMGYIGPYGIAWNMRGMEQVMLDMALNPGLVDAMVNKIEEFTLGCLDIVFTRYPGMLDLIGCGDDYGSQKGLLMSVDMINRFFFPSLKRHYDFGRKHGVSAYHHCCGAIFDLIPSFIDAGLEVLNPIQTSADGMEPVRIKKTFGRNLCFHGAIDTQQTLAHGTPKQVRAEVRQRMDELGPDGYILAPSHTLQPNVPMDNIVALYEAAQAYGKL